MDATSTELQDCYDLLYQQMDKLKDYAQENDRLNEVYEKSLAELKELYNYNSNLTQMIHDQQSKFENTHSANIN